MKNKWANIPGLSKQTVTTRREQYGYNEFVTATADRWPVQLLARFKNPLVLILLIAAIIAFIFGDRSSALIIFIIVLASVGIDFANSYRSEQAVKALESKVEIKVNVIRDSATSAIPARELVPGDIVLLHAGNVIPADGVIVESENICTNESALTGESFPQSKPTDAAVYMGSGVVSGTGAMRVTATGLKTKFSHIVSGLQSTARPTEFERDINEFSKLIMRITIGLVVFVCVVNLIFHRNFLDSILFSLALAVGLTPELLPLIITLNLTKGSLRIAKDGVIVKQLSAIQNLGSIDILCTDKTGTLTEDKIELIKFIDGDGNESNDTLKFGSLVSEFSSSAKQPLDMAISARHFNVDGYEKIDEVPFDFERKCESVIVHHGTSRQRTLISLGAPERILEICTAYETPSTLLAYRKKRVLETYNALSQQGFRVLGVAYKPVHGEHRYQKGDESDMVFVGFLAFIDPAKKSAAPTLKRMEAMGIAIKVVTGDNQYVASKIVSDLGVPITGILTGEKIEKMSERQLREQVEQTTIFARVDPEQKMRLIETLQANGHVVGYMGDGINDAPTLRAADVGISVNNATDVAKDAADFILLRKSLHELTEGIAEGRRTFSNTMKYLRMALSSNFGNMFSMAGSSLFLPFLPMLAPQILLNNLLYDVSQFAIPLDNVDNDEILHPRKIDIRSLERYMWSYGLLSSLFDFTTFGVLLYIFHVPESVFQSGWFIESIATQMFVVFVIRTRYSILKSRPAWPLVLSVVAMFSLALVTVLTPIREWFKFGQLTASEGLVLLALVLVYLVLAQLLKRAVWDDTPSSRKTHAVSHAQN